MARTSHEINRPVPTNCVMSSPRWGEFKLTVDALGYGLSIVTQPDGTTRTLRTFYPYVRTSGLWYVNAVFPEYQMWRSFQNWLFGYLVRATDPHKYPVAQPITVTVESEDWTKVGYPTSAIDYGDQWDRVIYQTTVSFASASDPETMSGNASRFRNATDDAVAAYYYPAGYQSNNLPAPVPNWFTLNNPDDIYDEPGGHHGGWPGPNIPIPN